LLPKKAMSALRLSVGTDAGSGVELPQPTLRMIIISRLVCCIFERFKVATPEF